MRGSSAQKRRLAVGGERERARRALQPQHRGVAARADHGVEEQLVVVLAAHPRLVGDGGRREQREQLAREVGAVGEARRERRRGIVGVQRVEVGGTRERAGRTPDRRPGSPTGHVGDRAARRTTPPAAASPRGARRVRCRARRPRRTGRRTRGSAPVSVTRPMTDRADLPARGTARAPRRGSPGVTIASMRSWLSDVITSTGVHPRLALGDARDVDVHARAGLGRGLRRRARDAGGAEVLHARPRGRRRAARGTPR